MVEGSIVKEILKCVCAVSESQRRLSSAGDVPSEKMLESAIEALEELKITLCNMASLLVTTPITGRMFLPQPADFVNDEMIMNSLSAQLS